MPICAEKICDMCTLLKYAKNAATSEICGSRVFVSKLTCLIVFPSTFITTLTDHSIIIACWCITMSDSLTVIFCHQ